MESVVSPDRRRKFLRLPLAAEGNFFTAERSGLIMLTDIGRGGVRAACNRSVGAGERLSMEVWLAGDIAPVQCRAEVLWAARNKREWEYGFSAGMRLADIDPADRWRLLEQAYEYWRQDKQQGG